MRIFKKKDSHYHNETVKINFVDKLDTYVGFDMRDLCCEQFGWVLVTSLDIEKEYKDEKSTVMPESVEDLIFDKDYFVEFVAGGPYVSTAHAAFKLISPYHDRPDKIKRERDRLRLQEGKAIEAYLILYNYHEGYYHHGFTMIAGDKILKKGSV